MQLIKTFGTIIGTLALVAVSTQANDSTPGSVSGVLSDGDAPATQTNDSTPEIISGVFYDDVASPQWCFSPECWGIQFRALAANGTPGGQGTKEEAAVLQPTNDDDDNDGHLRTAGTLPAAFLPSEVKVNATATTKSLFLPLNAKANATTTTKSLFLPTDAKPVQVAGMVCFYTGRCYENGVRVSRRRLEGVEGVPVKCFKRDYGLECVKA